MDDAGTPRRAGLKTTIGRRRFVQGTAAMAGGITAAGYVKPSMQSLGIPTALAVSGPGTAGHTPGFWANTGGGGGWNLWNTSDDPQWASTGESPGGVALTDDNPFDHTTKFNEFFYAHPNFEGMTPDDILEMYEIANQTGNIPDIEVKAARQLIAAYLSASYFAGYPLTTTQLKDAWKQAVESQLAGDPGPMTALHCTLDNANNNRALDTPCS
jgi:hypothetical protein